MSRTQEQYCAHTEYFHRIPDILRIQMSALIVAYQISRAPPRTSTQGTEHSRQVKRGAGVEIGYWMVPDGCGPHNGQGWAEWQILYSCRLSSGLTLLTTAPTANEFLRATEGPFAELKELVMQHTSIANRPRFQPLAPPEKILKEIVQKIWGHSSVQTVDDIGEILENGHVTDDLSLEVFLEACIAGYAKKRERSPQEVMKRFRLHNPSEAGQTAWQAWLKLHPGIDSQEAARLRKSHQEAVEKHYPDCAAEANAFYEKVLIHCGDIVLSKDERDAKPNEGLYLLQKVTGKYAAQLSMIAEMVKAMGLPLQRMPIGDEKLYDGIKAFRDFLHHLGAFNNSKTSTSEVFGASGLMKSIVTQAKQSVHFSDDLDRYLGNTTAKSEVECDAEDVDYHTPLLKMKEGLSTIDRAYGAHTVRRTDCAGKLKAMIQEATGIMDLGHNWRGVNILPFLLEHRLRFAGLASWCSTPKQRASFDHEDPVQTLRVEHMTDGMMMGMGLPDEYLKCEVLHYAPDGNGNVSKYALPQNEVRRAVGKTAIIPASSHKRKGSTPDPTTVVYGTRFNWRWHNTHPIS
ncbi:uncharacterized protein EI90DRAFT_3244867 [Cantharellus anzutake]|uniref:uncharacterized protein n=1 Tax=Cantharellus anzutake TaxID=1750568 RepID=UPI001903A6A4|nr:uncharacterized protein EI90DRAFT_3244867 [Cantharellus anzutake]KAF8324371.1 hypothetical protein EI90DRAFT_3244867 [Cantharellus anzutake]